LVLAYLDSELDAKTSQEIEIHLQSCVEWAELFEHEGKFNERLFRVLRRGHATLALWEQLESKVQPAAHTGWLARPWTLITVGSLAAFAVVMLLAALFAFRPGASSLDLAFAVAPDHAKYVVGQLQPQFAAQPPTETLAREQGRQDAEAFSKLPVSPGFRSDGKRVCHLSGVPVAWILGRDGQVPVSVVVLRCNELNQFPQLRERLAAVHPVICTRTGKFQFAARVVGEHVVCAVAAMSRERLENLVKTVPVAPDPG